MKWTTVVDRITVTAYDVPPPPDLPLSHDPSDPVYAEACIATEKGTTTIGKLIRIGGSWMTDPPIHYVPLSQWGGMDFACAMLLERYFYANPTVKHSAYVARRLNEALRENNLP